MYMYMFVHKFVKLLLYKEAVSQYLWEKWELSHVKHTQQRIEFGSAKTLYYYYIVLVMIGITFQYYTQAGWSCAQVWCIMFQRFGFATQRQHSPTST